MEHNSNLSHVVAGSMFAGFFSGYLINAFEVIKTRTLGQAFISVLPGSRSSNNSGVFASMLRNEGLGPLFRGSFHTCVTNLFRSPLSMVLYEYSKIYLSRSEDNSEVARL